MFQQVTLPLKSLALKTQARIPTLHNYYEYHWVVVSQGLVQASLLKKAWPLPTTLPNPAQHLPILFKTRTSFLFPSACRTVSSIWKQRQPNGSLESRTSRITSEYSTACRAGKRMKARKELGRNQKDPMKEEVFLLGKTEIEKIQDWIGALLKGLKKWAPIPYGTPCNKPSL